ncbi:MAG TPA: flippase-like domain-containing protein, partial [Dehalococcoidales bacterium]|nr:flippase-like domain-containing protein [Dehalococcoidales bacterium]
MKNFRINQRTIVILATIIFIVVAIVLIVLDWKEVKQVIGKADWYYIAVAFIATMFSYFMSSLGYALINRVFGVSTTYRDLIEVGFISSTLNSLLAFSGAVGHSLRVAYVKGPGTTSGAVLAASIFHSYINFIMMMLMMTIGVIWLLATHMLYIGGTITLAIIGLIVVLSTVVSTTIIFVSRLRRWILHVFARVWKFIFHKDMTKFIGDFNGALEKGMGAMAGTRFQLTAILTSMAAYWAFALVAVLFCFESFNVVLKPAALISGFGIGVAAGNLSMIPGGLGVQEAGIAGVYALLGTPLAQ